MTTPTPLHLKPFVADEYQARRLQLAKTLFEQTQGATVAIIPTASEMTRNRDAQFDFRPDSYFYYLTGFVEPEAVLVLICNGEQSQSILFCRDKNPEREIWDGRRLGYAQAVETLKVDQAFPIDAFTDHMTTWLLNHQHIHLPTTPIQSFEQHIDQCVKKALTKAKSQARNGKLTAAHWHDVYPAIDQMRLIKSTSEQQWMARAGQISALGHIRAMQTCKPGMRELDLEAEIRYVFAKNGAQHDAYSAIVAGGENACILHYRAGLAELKEGDLCLIDAGAEYGFYAGDITRTFPINGRFTKAQQQVYEIVLAAQEAAISAARPGNHFNHPHEAALNELCKGLLDLGILKRDTCGSVEEVIHQRLFMPFYMHRTSHWLGMDVHDCGAYAHPQPNNSVEHTEPNWQILRSGMALTIEPGLYIQPSADVPEAFWNIGIRIEDDIIINDQHCDILTRDVPVTVKEIENLMNP